MLPYLSFKSVLLDPIFCFALPGRELQHSHHGRRGGALHHLTRRLVRHKLAHSWKGRRVFFIVALHQRHFLWTEGIPEADPDPGKLT
jgi:hypothetical protein